MESVLFWDAYEVFEDGRVYSHFRDRFLKIQHNRNGYCYVTLYRDRKPKMFFVHRLVAICFIENPENFPHINHKDGNKENNHWRNLEWCTPLQNNVHARCMGLNDISKSNSERWKESSFRKKTSKSISEGRKGLYADSGNPANRYTPFFNGCEITRKELGELLGISPNTVKQYIYDAAHGVKRTLFEKHNIQIRETEKSASTIESIA